MRISLRQFERAANETPVSGNARKGFVLVEVIVAMVLLAVAVSSLAALIYSVSQSGMVATGNAYRNGVLMHEVNRLEGIPYDSVHVGTSYTAVNAAPYPHTRTVTVSEPVTNVVKTVKIVITPANPRYKPDTANFTRTKARTSRVLCTDCPQG
ncbi:MAG TPA: prepilin-type N-terminal cleavage/methylation domain-containing protein [Gemmatimonadaceae bacterium]|jgi:prepilin-type N-terminal cleavage/methylation domain-containing protein